MNDKLHRWYHYLMMPFSAMIVICFVALIVGLLQMMVYEGLDRDIAVLETQCYVEITSVAPMETPTTTMCGDEEISLGSFGNLEAIYLHAVLTTNTQPVIMCVKTVSNYFDRVKWSCDTEMETEEL